MANETLCKNCKNKEFNVYGCQNERSIAMGYECGNYNFEVVLKNVK